MKIKALTLLCVLVLAGPMGHRISWSAEPKPVTIATIAAGQSGYIAALIESKGIAAKHGIKINNQMMGFTEGANALKLGRTQFSTMQPSTAVNLWKSGTQVQMFVPQIWSGNAFLVRKNSAYKSLGDLKGKKIGNFSRVTGAFFFSAVIAKQKGLDIEKDFQSIPAETAALIALLERGEVETINMFEPHTTKLVLTGRYRVLIDFDDELNAIFGSPPLKTGIATLKETAAKHPDLVKAVRGAYEDAVKLIKSGQDQDFFKANAKEFFNLATPEEIATGMKQSQANFADQWGPSFFAAQNKILEQGIALGLLPKIGDLNNLWLK